MSIHKGDQKATDQHNQDQKQIVELTASVKATEIAQANNTAQFFASLQDLSQQVADFRTEAKATGLQGRADRLQKALDATQKAMVPQLAQSSAHLVIDNVQLPRQGPFKETEKISFDLINRGNSAAFQVTQSGGLHGWDFSKNSKENYAVTSQPSSADISGFSLGQGEKRTFEIPGTEWVTIENTGHTWVVWRKFTYLNVFGETKNECILIMGGKHGLERAACIPESKSQP